MNPSLALPNNELDISSSQPMPEIDSSGFFQVPTSMAIKAIEAGLTGADLRLWLYVQAIDPWGNKKPTLNVAKILEVVKISIRQFKRSAKKIEELGLYCFTPVLLQGQNLAGLAAQEISKRKKQAKSSDKSKMTKMPNQGQECLTDDKNADAVPKMPNDGQNWQDEAPKPLTDEDSRSPNTSLDYLDFKNTLLEGERENFFSYCKKITAGFNKPVADLDDWLASKNKAGENRWEIQYKEFKAQETAATKAEAEASLDQQQEQSETAKQAEEFLRRNVEAMSSGQKPAAAVQNDIEQPCKTEVKEQVLDLLNEPPRRTSTKQHKPLSRRTVLGQVQALYDANFNPQPKEEKQYVRIAHPPAYS